MIPAPEPLRPPGLLDATAAAYKAWLHLNVFDHASGAVGLVNVSLHGSPADPRSRAVGAALVHLPGRGWVGNAEVAGASEAAVGPSDVRLRQVALAADPVAGLVQASVRMPGDGLSAEVVARSSAPPSMAQGPVPFGSGWIAWHVLPRLAVRGEIDAAGDVIDLARASAYHDSNWGRWHWGDDAGWEWGAFLAPDPGPAFVLTRTTDRTHRAAGPARLMVRSSAVRRTLAGPAVTLSSTGVLDERPRRVPGAMAALNQDRARPRLPERVVVRARDGTDDAEIEFVPRAVAQIVAADPAVRGYAFVHEMVGGFTCAGRVAGRDVSCTGLGVFEIVD